MPVHTCVILHACMPVRMCAFTLPGRAHQGTESPARGHQLEEKPSRLTSTAFWSAQLSPACDVTAVVTINKQLFLLSPLSHCFLGTVHLLFHHPVDHGTGLETSRLQR